ncbi:hypothetical protein L0Y40_00215 [Candidatus Wolfebacteria bacterium]|nr:hypothetical protein [Candidatus Wolfebacteria bacterium]
MDHDPNEENIVPDAVGRGASKNNVPDEGITPPGERLLQQEIEELMAQTPAVGGEVPIRPKAQATSISSESSLEKPMTSPKPETKHTPLPDKTKKTVPDKPAESEILDLDEADDKSAALKHGRESSIRTYYGDVADAVRSRQTSIADIAIAEQQRREEGGEERVGVEAGEEKHSGLSVFLVVLGVVLVLAGTGIIGYLYVLQPMQGVLHAPTITDTLVPADNETDFDITNLTRSELLGTLEVLRDSLPGDTGEVTVIRPTRIATLADNSTESTPVGPREFLNLFATHIDAAFLRSVEPEYMVGIHRLPAGMSEPFLILTVSFFENAFAGLLRWEPFMADDLPFLVHPVRDRLPTATATPAIGDDTSGSEETVTNTVPENAEVESGPYVFKDVLIVNRNARVLQNKAGDIRMLYSFPRQNLIIITTNPETLKELFNRMSVSRFEG